MVAICQNNPRELTPAARRLPQFLDLDEICRKQDEEEERLWQEQKDKDKLELRQHRTKTALRLSTTSACSFSVILHKTRLITVRLTALVLHILTKK